MKARWSNYGTSLITKACMEKEPCPQLTPNNEDFFFLLITQYSCVFPSASVKATEAELEMARSQCDVHYHDLRVS